MNYEVIKNQRLKKKLSICKLANISGVSHVSIINAEKGKVANINTLERICEPLELKVCIIISKANENEGN